MRPLIGVLLSGLLAIQVPGPLAAQTVARAVAAPVSGAAVPVPLNSRLHFSLPAGSALGAPSAGALPSAGHVPGVLRTQTELPAVSAPDLDASLEPASAPSASPDLKSAFAVPLEVQRQDGVLTVNGVEVPAAEKVAAMDPGSTRRSGDEVMDALLGLRPKASADSEALPELGGSAVEAVPAGLPAPSLAAPAVYGTRILHLHYPHRSWDHVAGDMAADDKVKATNGEHPVGALREILNRTGWAKENPAGLSISFTPALMEIGRRLWGMGWVQRWREAIGWRAASGGPRMEMLPELPRAPRLRNRR